MFLSQNSSCGYNSQIDENDIQQIHNSCKFSDDQNSSHIQERTSLNDSKKQTGKSVQSQVYVQHSDKTPQTSLNNILFSKNIQILQTNKNNETGKLF